MSIARLYQPVALSPHQALTLDEKASHYLSHVLRAKPGDQLTLFNGLGGEYTAIVDRLDKKSVKVMVQSFIDREVESPIQIHLAQGIARGEKMDTIVQKSTELGVTSIIPLITERCNVRLDKDRETKRREHWQAVAVSACEQSGRNRVPEVVLPVDFQPWLSRANATLKFILTPHVKEAMPPLNLESTSSILMLIGPEGGLSDHEVALAMMHGFIPLSLGPRILRTETASLAAMAALQWEYGDF